MASIESTGGSGVLCVSECVAKCVHVYVLGGDIRSEVGLLCSYLFSAIHI